MYTGALHGGPGAVKPADIEEAVSSAPKSGRLVVVAPGGGELAGRIKSHSDTQSNRVDKSSRAALQRVFRAMAQLRGILVGFALLLGCARNAESSPTIGFNDAFEVLLSAPPNSVYRLSEVTSFEWTAVIVIPGMPAFRDDIPVHEPCEIPGSQPDPEIVLVVFCRDGAAPLKVVADIGKVDAEYYRVYGPDTNVRVDGLGRVTFVDPSEGPENMADQPVGPCEGYADGPPCKSARWPSFQRSTQREGS